MSDAPMVAAGAAAPMSQIGSGLNLISAPTIVFVAIPLALREEIGCLARTTLPASRRRLPMRLGEEQSVFAMLPIHSVLNHSPSTRANALIGDRGSSA